MNDVISVALGNSKNLSEIDLHGSDPREAIDKLNKDLFLYFERKEKYCRVIHGIGKGVLREKVLEELRKNPMVKTVHEEESGGSCVVEF